MHPEHKWITSQVNNKIYYPKFTKMLSTLREWGIRVHSKTMKLTYSTGNQQVWKGLKLLRKKYLSICNCFIDYCLDTKSSFNLVRWRLEEEGSVLEEIVAVQLWHGAIEDVESEKKQLSICWHSVWEGRPCVEWGANMGKLGLTTAHKNNTFAYQAVISYQKLETLVNPELLTLMLANAVRLNWNFIDNLTQCQCNTLGGLMPLFVKWPEYIKKALQFSTASSELVKLVNTIVVTNSLVLQ